MSRSFRRWPRIRPLLALAIVAALVIWSYARGNSRGIQLGAFSSSPAVARVGPCEVLDVIDAATLLVRQPAERSRGEFVGKVRLLGIDPPAEAQAAEAKALLTELTAAPFTRLELDKRRIDAQGNFLAYVYVSNKHLSEELVAAGLARVDTYPGDSMTVNRLLLRAQDQARIKQIGIWAPKGESSGPLPR